MRQGVSALLAGFALVGSAQAAWPDRPVKIVVPFAAGGGSDFIARFIAQKLSGSLHQQVVVENRPGAGGLLGVEVGVHAPADGYTLTLIASSYCANASLYPLKFDPLADITPIIQLSKGPLLVVVNPALPVRNIRELIEQARSRSGQIAFASSGQGSIIHLATELFASSAGIRINHVPYKGTGPALTDTIGGQTQVFFSSTASALPHVQGGKLRAIAVTTTARLPALPEVPTVAESGLAGYDVTLWHGLIGPKGLSREVVDRVNAAAAQSLGLKEAAEQLKSDGVAPAGGTPEQFRAQIAGEIAMWRKVVTQAGVRAE
jgi:tripartite-type tricarboxylate transporter receptor subunit TctC